MSSKPLTLPVWATTGSIVVPAPAIQQAGHQANQAPFHSYENWYKNLVYLWAQYLNDGDVGLNNVTVGGTLGVTGATTVGGTLGVTGLLSGTAASFSSGMTAAGGLTVPTGQTVALNGSTTLTVGGLITATSGVTAAVNANVTVSGTGTYKHGLQTLPIQIGGTRDPDSVLGFADSTVSHQRNVFTISTSAGVGVFPFMLPLGKRIVQLRANIIDSNNGGNAKIGLITGICPASLGQPLGASAALGTQTTSNFGSTSVGNGTKQLISSTTINTTVVTDTTYAAIIIGAGGSATQAFVFQIYVDYDQP